MSKVYLAEKTALTEHTGNGNIHVTQDEKTKIVNALTANSVVPATGADLTKLIATIGGVSIKAPDGGGGKPQGQYKLTVQSIGSLGDEHLCTVMLIPSMEIYMNRDMKGRTFEGVDGIILSGLNADMARFDATNVEMYRDYEISTILDNVNIFKLTGDCVITYLAGGACLAADTDILMSDGSLRAIKYITVGDLVMSVNPETGALEPDRVIASDGDTDNRHDVKDVWHFDDGSVIETVHRHRVYNVDLGEPMYMEAWNVGERCYREDGSTPRLVSHERVTGDWRHCTLFTEKWNNYFANGMLCGNRKSAKLTIGD